MTARYDHALEVLASDQTAEAERQLLACLMLDRAAWAHLPDGLRVEHFLEGGHRVIFETLRAMHRAGRPTDNPALLPADFMPKVAKALGVERNAAFIYVAKLLAQSWNAHDAKWHARDVIAASKRRRLGTLADMAASRVTRADEPEAVAEWIATQAGIIGDDARSSEVERGATLASLLGAIATDEHDHSRQVMTGIVPIDERCGPLLAGEMMVVAGRPGDGKSSLCQQAAIHAAEHHGRRVVYLTMELPAKQMAQRFATTRLGIAQRKMRAGGLEPIDRARIQDLAADMEALPLHIESGIGLPVSKVRPRLLDLAPDMLVVDHLGRFAPEHKGRDLYTTTTENVIAVKALALELHCPLLLAVQLNRSNEKEKSRPSLSNLRNSGAIEEESDAVLLIHHPNGNSERGRAEIIVAKHRAEGCDCINVSWEPARMTFGEYVAVPGVDGYEARREPEFDEYNAGGSW